jgi:hypothetical protein
LAGQVAKFYLEVGNQISNNYLILMLMREGIMCPSTFSKLLAGWVRELQVI